MAYTEGGDRHASPEFFRKLQQVLKKNAVFFIVDEVQTGFGELSTSIKTSSASCKLTFRPSTGATGTFWAHEKWNLPEPADFVTFSKKAQASGFYHKISTRPKAAYQQYNTWLVRLSSLVSFKRRSLTSPLLGSNRETQFVPSKLAK